MQGADMTKQFPWDYHTDLTEERLIAVAEMIVAGRHTALDRFDEEAGDNGWTLGCCAFQYGRARILRAIDGDEYPWLTAIDRTLQLIFKIGDVPVRIYKGEADDPTDRTTRRAFGEVAQIEMLFPEHDVARGLVYRFAIETDFDGSVLAVKFVGLRGDTPVLIWDVPFDAARTATGTVGREATESVELAPPAVVVRTDRADEQRKTGA